MILGALDEGRGASIPGERGCIRNVAIRGIAHRAHTVADGVAVSARGITRRPSECHIGSRSRVVIVPCYLHGGAAAVRAMRIGCGVPCPGPVRYPAIGKVAAHTLRVKPGPVAVTPRRRRARRTSRSEEHTSEL